MKNLWEESCEEHLATSTFSGNTTADLVVVGGGFTGCSAALEAAKRGAKVILLEGRTIGYGGSGRNVGLVNAGLWLPPDTVEAQMGDEAGKKLNQSLAEAPDKVFKNIEEYGISCEATRSGTLHCAHAPRGLKDLKNRHTQQVARGAPVTLLNAVEAQKAVGSGEVYGALQDMRAGTIQPMGYVKGLARAAQSLGAQIYEGTKVTQIQSDGQGWKVTCAGGVLSAGAVLIAGNAYGEAAAQRETPKTPIVHYFQLATAPMKDVQLARILPGLQGCWDTGLIMKSFRRDATGRLVFGAMGKPDLLGLHKRWATRALGKMFPALQDTQLTHFWSGRIAMTGDHLPKIMKFGPQGFVIFGYSGRGIGPGTVFGAAATDALLNGSEGGLPVALVDQHKDALSNLRSLYYETGARVMHLI